MPFVLDQITKVTIIFVNAFMSEGFPIDEKNRLALDRVKSTTVISAPTDLKGLTYTVGVYGRDASVRRSHELAACVATNFPHSFLHCSLH